MNEHDGQHPDGRWLPVRPMSLDDIRILHRLAVAWDAFTGQVDVVYWEIE